MKTQPNKIMDEVTLQNGNLSVCVRNRSGDSSLKALSHWAQLAAAVLASENVSAGQLDVAFITSEEIAGLNQEHMGKEGPTDVLAFPIDIPATSGQAKGDIETVAHLEAILLGDVVINVERANEQAVQFDMPTESEISLLLIHGVLHVLGYDHQEAHDREQMEAKERTLLKAVGYERRANQ